uniref:Uncharacterized protein n=1 Tax=Anguilla anguilla TaxID=7936 RepID=A0A0E9R3P7_ANGAN
MTCGHKFRKLLDPSQLAFPIRQTLVTRLMFKKQYFLHSSPNQKDSESEHNVFLPS